MQIFFGKSFLNFDKRVRKIDQNKVFLLYYLRFKKLKYIEFISDTTTIQKRILPANKPGGGLYRCPPG